MAAELVIDVAARTASVGGSRVHLTRLEFDLLALLASRPGEILSRDELLETVWHSNREWQSPATVNEHVRRLRAKLDRSPTEPSLITTVRGFGYTFDPRADELAAENGPPDHGAGHCLVVLDGTRIVHASPAFVEFVRADTSDEIVGRETFEFATDDSLPAAKRLAEQRASGEIPRPERVTIRRRDGTEATVDVATSIVDWGGRRCYQISVWPVPDVTSAADAGRNGAALDEADGILQPLRTHRSTTSRTLRRRHARSDRNLASDIARGIDAGEFQPYYEPIIHLETNRAIAVEALARWHHPTRGLLAPAAFLGTAERTGDIVRLGRHLLHASCTQVIDWERDGHTIDLAFNLSARQLLDGSLIADVTSALDATGLPSNRLLVEITETDLIEDVDEAAKALRRLADHGIRVSIDDFGTGWASLTYLQRFPVHILKIDRSFTAGVITNPNETAIARAIISLGNELDLLVIAEGIETADQKAAMYDLGCWIGQGYHFARPQPGPNVILSRGHDLVSATPSRVAADARSTPVPGGIQAASANSGEHLSNGEGTREHGNLSIRANVADQADDDLVPGEVLYTHKRSSFSRQQGLRTRATEEQIRERLYYEPCAVCGRPSSDPTCQCLTNPQPRTSAG